MAKCKKIAKLPEPDLDKFEALREINPEALLADGLEDAYLGYIENRWAKGAPAVAVYSIAKCIEVFMKRDGMSRDEAEEFFSFNTEGAYVGPGTPLYVNDWFGSL